ncbi:hypothetical protein D9M68_783100 [compost metagenome]
MTQTNNLTRQKIHPDSLAKRMLIGAAIGLILISMFLLSVGKGDPAWAEFWWIKPLVIVPLAGSGAGLVSYLLDEFRAQGGWVKILAIGLTVIVYIIALWLGSVLGLDGTLWN